MPSMSSTPRSWSTAPGTGTTWWRSVKPHAAATTTNCRPRPRPNSTAPSDGSGHDEETCRFDCRQVHRADDERKPKRPTMTEYPQDFPTLSAGPPPVMYSDHVYGYPADPRSRPPWL